MLPMAVLDIVRFGDPCLRFPGEPVRQFGPWLDELIDDMFETMHAAPGAGLAAHQVGRSLQVCVISVDGAEYEFVNPRIVHLSGERDDYEGCLSLPDVYGLRRRAGHAVVTGQDRRGRRVTVSGHGELAKAIQHEFDHLQGILYVDGLPPGSELIDLETVRARVAAERESART
jgi:peptide deformylase